MANIYKTLSKKAFAMLVFSLCCAVASFGALSGSYTINSAAPADVTNYQNFRSFFNHLMSNTRLDGGPVNGAGVSGPVTVTVVGGGTYTEQLTLNAITGVNATNTITVNGNGATLQFAPTLTSDLHIIRFNGADYVTFKNLTIKTTSASWGWGVHFMNNSDFNTIDNCVIDISAVTSSTSTYSVGVAFSNSTTSPTTTGASAKNVVISNNIIKGNPTSYGMYWGITLLPQSSASTPSNIKIINNVIQDFYIYGIYAMYTNGTLISGNTIGRPNKTLVSTTYGIYYVNGMNNDSIINNRITNLFNGAQTSTSTAYGLFFSTTNATSTCVVANNAIYNNRFNGQFIGIYAWCAPSTKFFHNTISIDETTATATGATYGFYYGYSGCPIGTATEFRNNIISITRGGTGAKYAYFHSNGVNLTTNNNVVFVSGTNSYYASLNGSPINTFTDWQNSTASGAPFDAQSVSAHPNYTNLATGDLTPRLLNVDDVGTSTGGIVTKDFNGNIRNASSPDAGAFEFNINANVSRVVINNLSPCEETQEAPKVWIKNNSASAISGFSVSYRVNGSNLVTENFAGSINAGDSAMHTFSKTLYYSTAGLHAVDARAGFKPWIGLTNVNVKAAPKGADVAAGTNFKGIFASGNSLDPDIVANPDEINYELKPPAGYTNAGFGTTWIINSLTAKTVNNANIPAADTATFVANASQNARVRYRPSANFTDSSVVFTSIVYSLTTNCPAPPITRQVFVAPRPKANFVAPNVCDKEEMLLSSTSSISSGTMKYKWNLGDGDTSDNADVQKTYATHNTYQVKLLVTSNYGYTDSVTKTVSVFEKPTVNFNYTNACEGAAVPFTDASTVPNGSPVYKWEFGDGIGTSASATPSYSYTSPNMYMATLTVTDAKGCQATITKPVTVAKKSIASFNVPSQACNLSEVTFTNSSLPNGPTGYTWKYGDGTEMSSFDGNHTYTNAGTFNITLVVLNEFGCKDSMVKSFTLKESPAINYTMSTQCVGETVNFNNTTVEPAGSTVQYEWNLGDGTTANTKNTTYTYLGAGDYEVKLVARASNGCVSEQKSIVALGERPLVDFSIPQTGCKDQPVTVINNSIVSQGSLSYLWTMGDGSDFQTKDVVKTYTTAGNYAVTLKASSVKGCADSVTRNIIVAATPESDFNFESAKTGNGGILFTPKAPNGSGEYKWSYGDGSQGDNKGQHTFKFFGNSMFKVTLTVTDNGCKSSTSKFVVINALGIEDMENNRNVEVYPNPNSGSFNVAVNLPVTANTSVKVVNIAGQTVKEFGAADIINGKLTADLTDAAAGVYFVQVISEGSVITKKVTITK